MNTSSSTPALCSAASRSADARARLRERVAQLYAARPVSGAAASAQVLSIGA